MPQWMNNSNLLTSVDDNNICSEFFTFYPHLCLFIQTHTHAHNVNIVSWLFLFSPYPQMCSDEHKHTKLSVCLFVYALRFECDDSFFVFRSRDRKTLHWFTVCSRRSWKCLLKIFIINSKKAWATNQKRKIKKKKRCKGIEVEMGSAHRRCLALFQIATHFPHFSQGNSKCPDVHVQNSCSPNLSCCHEFNSKCANNNNNNKICHLNRKLNEGRNNLSAEQI